MGGAGRPAGPRAGGGPAGRRRAGGAGLQPAAGRAEGDPAAGPRGGAGPLRGGAGVAPRLPRDAGAARRHAGEGSRERARRPGAGDGLRRRRRPPAAGHGAGDPGLEPPDPQERKALWIQLADLRERAAGRARAGLRGPLPRLPRRPGRRRAARPPRGAGGQDRAVRGAGGALRGRDRQAASRRPWRRWRWCWDGSTRRSWMARRRRPSGTSGRARSTRPPRRWRSRRWSGSSSGSRPGPSWPRCCRRGPLAASGGDRVQLLYRLGRLCEERLAAPAQAAQAYQQALAVDPRHLPSLQALEPLYEAAGRKEELARQPGGAARGGERRRHPRAAAGQAGDAGRRAGAARRGGRAVARGAGAAAAPRGGAGGAGGAAAAAGAVERAGRAPARPHRRHRGPARGDPAQRQAGLADGREAGRSGPGHPVLQGRAGLRLRPTSGRWSRCATSTRRRATWRGWPGRCASSSRGRRIRPA